MGTIQQAPQGKLKVTLTPKTPALNNRAYLSVFYPQSMPLSNDRNFVSFGEFYDPGYMSYSVRLDKGKKYLIEIIAGAWNANGGSVKHSIGGGDSTHEFANSDAELNISRIIEVSESGWVSGKLEATDPAPYQWRVFSVSINQMD